MEQNPLRQSSIPGPGGQPRHRAQVLVSGGARPRRGSLQRPEPAILLDATAPYKILAANRAWQDQCGYGQEAIGASPKILQGELTDQVRAKRFAYDCITFGHARTTLINYTKAQQPFAHRLHAEAVKQEGSQGASCTKAH